MRRLLGVLVLLAVAALALYYWRYRPAGAERAAEGAASEARQAMETVGEKFRQTKHGGSVKAAFELNRELSRLPIDVDATEAGVITLRGRVPNAEVKALAGRVAASVPGVTQVVDQLTLDASLPAASPATGGPTSAPPAPSAPPSPVVSERARRVEQALSGNPSLAGSGITVREEGGRLILTGRVRTAAEKDLAGLLARDAAGGPVENNLAVGP